MLFRFLMVMFFLSIFVLANHLSWQGDYDSALNQAKKEKKSLLVFVVKANNALCNEIIKNVFMNQP